MTTRLKDHLLSGSAAVATLVHVAFCWSAPAHAQVVANPGDNINVDGQTISASPTTPALHAAGGTITGTGTTVSSSHDTIPVTQVDSGGSLTLTNSSITSTAWADGISVWGSGTTATLNNTTITTSSNGAFGANVTGGSLTMTGGSITTSGTNASGMQVQNPGTVVTLTGTQITTTGNNAHGIVEQFLSPGGGLNASNVTISTTGVGASALLHFAFNSTVTFTNNSSLSSTQGPAIYVNGGNLDLHLTDTTVTGNGVAVSVMDDAVNNYVSGLTLTASSSTFNGTVQMLGTGASTITATSNTVFNGDIVGAGASETLNLTDSTVNGNIQLNGGADSFTMTRGSVTGTLDMGAGNDTARLISVLQANAPTMLNGGTGTDALTFDATAFSSVAALANWENVNLVNGAQLTLNQNLTLGDAGTLTGALSIDSTSTLFAGNGVNPVIQAFGAGQAVTVNNAGLIDLTNGPSGPTDRLTIAGNYVGNGGNLAIETQLGGDASPTDQLIINGGSATGSTTVTVNNTGGTGGMTSGTGIPIVVATGGATTTPGAFTLGGPVVAGLYQYQLFQGPASGGTPDQQNSWYLRSHTDGPGPNPNPIPIYRPEGAMFASMPSLGRELTRNTIGTFHDYNGDQGLIRGNGAPGRAWGRVFGESIEQGHAGLLSPNFKGHAYGFQTGVDLFESETPDGIKDRFGVFFGYAQAKGEVRGFALGVQNHYVGDSSLEGLSGGAYWTRVGPRDEYLEARMLGTRYTGDGTSFANNLNIDVKGTSFAASLEGGLPVRFGVFVIEPQAQLIYQYLDMQGSDPLSKIAYDTPDALYARVGLRLSSDGLFGLSNVRPYVKANLWHDAVGADKAIFSPTDVVETSFRATALELGGGVVAQLTQYASLWAMADYTTDVSGNQERQIVRGNAGVRIVW